MKRSVDEDSEELRDCKRRRVLEDAEAFSLPTELWEQIVIIAAAEHYSIFPPPLSLVSKRFARTVFKEIHRYCAKSWPEFYEKAMQHLNNAKLWRMFFNLKRFSERKLDAEHEEETFETDFCPVCSKVMDQSGPRGEILHCANCLTKYGANIEWRLEIRKYVCRGCDKMTPFVRFWCEGCSNEYGMCCGDDYLSSYPADQFFCTRCVGDCEHCDKASAMIDQTCDKCHKLQCDQCRKKECNNVVIIN